MSGLLSLNDSSYFGDVWHCSKSVGCFVGYHKVGGRSIVGSLDVPSLLCVGPINGKSRNDCRKANPFYFDTAVGDVPENDHFVDAAVSDRNIVGVSAHMLECHRDNYNVGGNNTPSAADTIAGMTA